MTDQEERETDRLHRVAMRIDGVRMNDSFSIGSFADARRNLIDLDTLKSLEIVRGPASALYGSDAVGGVVGEAMHAHHDFHSSVHSR